MKTIRSGRNHQGIRAWRFIVLLATLGLANVSQGGARLFTGVYEAQTSPGGTIEYEQWVTWKTHKVADPGVDTFDFRHELEFSVSDNAMVALYLSDWSLETGGADGASVTWKNVAVETIYMFLNPTLDPVGLAGYLEVRSGDKLLAVEGKVLIQKNQGKWTAVWNGVVESEWEGAGLDKQTGVLEETAGVSYEIKPALRLGVELKHELESADWSEWQSPILYVGPTASYRRGDWWMTLTPAMQTTNHDDEPDYVVRMIMGVTL